MTNPSPDMPSEPVADAAVDAASPAAAKRAPRRPAKADAVLAAAVDEARAGLLEVVAPAEVGNYVGAVADAERLVTHRFTSLRPGYHGWYWYATVARVPRSKKVTVSEVGLLPSDEALLAPEWVPWSDRLRPEDIAAEQEQQAQEEAAREAAAAGHNDADRDDADRDDADDADRDDADQDQEQRPAEMTGVQEDE
ncbi:MULTISPECIES: DUF3027 domain-containing protein [unclassified Arthrobacter]|uniref:DUF3027 domain-containing protein n=1 Tax=unclassified Arthrobacter TaxID=235627 RepID=UPI001E3BF851|nr:MULTISPECIES: DUF3027 domain-containing protein [unclassified Arthrobacter]MCC9145839.1 DUF3027 domain-containing protein [Arthrobacter sp. zg-Y919]MDK1277068.1 DUF3027 domain-containing protein [Arthrobacter sp. zg.Y919]WIB04472.1 DUF3027 domain-containing protein [Arthrobacter sp. zg-Y919]